MKGLLATPLRAARTTFARRPLPGTYIDWVGETAIRPNASISATVAVAGVADWGPLGSEGVQRYNSFGEYESVYGDGDSPLRDAVLGAFVGSGLPDEPAAGSVLVHRAATDDAAKSTITLDNTAGTPVDALRIDALYAGERGDRIDVVIAADPADATNLNRLSVLFDGVTVERFSHAKADLAALAALVNATSKFITAEVLVDGTALALGTFALTAGDDGGTLTATEYTDALDALEFEPFSILAFPNLTDSAIVTLAEQFVIDQDEANRPVMLVVGGPTAETIDAAITRVAAIRDPHIVSLGGGTYHDDFLDKDVNSAQIAPRVAGALAGRGSKRALTFAPFAGLSVVDAAIVSEDLATARDAGLTVFRRSESEAAELRISQGVTTFNSTSTVGKPYDVFSDPRLVRVMDLFVRDVKTWGDEELIGDTRVTEETRVALRNYGSKKINELLADGLILPGSSVIDEPFFRVLETTDPDLDDALPFEFGFKFARTTNFLIGRGKVR